MSHRKQSALELQKRSELHRTKQVLQFFSSNKTNSSSKGFITSNTHHHWKSALQGLALSHKQGVPLHSDQLSPIIENAPNFQIAQNVFYKTHSKLRLRWSYQTKLSVMKAAANHGKWDFALGFLVRNLDPANSFNEKQLERNPDFPQKLTEETVKSLAKSSHEGNTNWAIALATVSMMRNPSFYNNNNFNEEEIFGVNLQSNKKNKTASTTSSSSKLLSSSSSQQQQGDNNGKQIVQFDEEKNNKNPIYKRIDASPELMQSLMVTLGKANRWVESITLLRAMERQMLPITTPTYENAIRACYSKKKHDEVISIVKKIMISENNTLREPVARLTMRSLESSTSSSKSSFGLPAPSSQAANHWLTSIKIFQALADQGLALTRQTYESPIRCCVAAGQWEAA